MALDATQIGLVIGTALIVGAPLITWGLGKFPGTAAWVRKNAIAGYVYLDKVKDDVPAAGKEAYDAAYAELDALIQSLEDGKIDTKELRHLATHAFELVMAVKGILI